MKRFILSVITTGMVSLAVSQNVRYDITGKITGAEGVTFQLQRTVGGKPVVIDTAMVVKGTFRLNSGSIQFPEYVSLVAVQRGKGLSFFLENNKILVSGHIDSLNMVKITGSKTQDDLYRLQDLLKPINEQALSFVNQKMPVPEEILEAFKDSQKSFVKNNLNSFLSPHVMINIMNDLTVNEFDSIVAAMDPDVTKSPVMVEVKSRYSLTRATALGQKAPDFTLNNVDGKPVSLSSKIGTKLLLIDFWAAWCGPCRRENPFVVRTFTDFHGKGFDVFGVSLDRKREDWVKAINDDKLTWTQVSDLNYFNSPAAALYGVNSIPANFLLNEKGIIIAKNLRGDVLYNKVKKMLDAQ